MSPFNKRGRQEVDTRPEEYFRLDTKQKHKKGTTKSDNLNTTHLDALLHNQTTKKNRLAAPNAHRRARVSNHKNAKKKTCTWTLSNRYRPTVTQTTRPEDCLADSPPSQARTVPAPSKVITRHTYKSQEPPRATKRRGLLRGSATHYEPFSCLPL